MQQSKNPMRAYRDHTHWDPHDMCMRTNTLTHTYTGHTAEVVNNWWWCGCLVDAKAPGQQNKFCQQLLPVCMTLALMWRAQAASLTLAQFQTTPYTLPSPTPWRSELRDGVNSVEWHSQLNEAPSCQMEGVNTAASFGTNSPLSGRNRKCRNCM